MAATTELAYGVTGQVVEFYPSEWPIGIPSSASASVYDGTRSNDDTADFAPSVTVDSVSTTVDVVSGYSQTNRRRLYIAATTGIAVGRDYRIENGVGQYERVRVAAISSADYVDLEDDLQYDYPITVSTVKGVRMSWTVDATWVAAETNVILPTEPPYRVIWTYTVGAIVRKAQTYLRLVRLPSGHSIVVADLEELWPDLMEEEFRERRGQQFRYAINAAWERVRIDLIARDIQPAQVLDAEVIDELVRAKSIHVIANMGIAPGNWDVAVFASKAEDDYKDLFNRTITALKARISQNAEGAISREPEGTLWFSR